jgi:hypothetical protein
MRMGRRHANFKEICQVTEIVRASIRSYRDLPKLLYHIQWKFRDEVRPRFGVMRGHEFLMKDAYSFDLDAAGAGCQNRQKKLSQCELLHIWFAPGRLSFTYQIGAGP